MQRTDLAPVAGSSTPHDFVISGVGLNEISLKKTMLIARHLPDDQRSS